MAVAPLVAKYENKELIIMRGDRYVIQQPFRPAIGDEERREWIDEADALAYWDSIKEDYAMAGCTSEEIIELTSEVN